MTVTSPCTQGLMDSSHPQALLSRLNEQRSQGLFCDVTIVVEDVKFRAHRNILAACSGYFRSAFTSPEVWTSSQVLELMDLRSEVFASILNLLYCSKVTSSPSTEDTRCLMAAGKRLGIPFLEKLVEQDRQDSGGPQIQTSTNPVKTTGHSKAQGPRKAKKETSRPEEPDSARGPRITNAFSITEVGPGNNLFTPLDLHRGERPSPDLGQTPAGCPAPCPLAVDNEPMQALSEHSYAVISQGPRDPEHRDGNQEDNKKGTKPTQSQPRQLASRNSGPLKKRHRLRAALSKSTPPTPAVAHEPVHPTGSSPALIKPTVQPVGTSPPSLYPQIVHTSRANELPLAIDNGYRELDAPPLSPHTDDSISIYSCEHCPEIFTNKALLTVHTEMHKKRFVSHLFCKFCRRKFMHLKRLRNHETVCTKAQRGSPEHEPQGKEARADHYSDSMPSTNNTVTNVQLSPPEFPDPFPPTSLQKNPTSKTLQAVDRLVKPSGGQRVYNCSVCKRAYVTVSSLKRHENVHSWQRAYPCHYCNKVFALAEYRTKHEIWHTGERRYQCIFCLETFMTYYILKNHQKAFHGIHPRLSVSKKSANGGFKGSVYPIKLYRLLPMKFRKRRYKTYSQTYSEELGGSEQAPLGCSSPIPSFDDGGAMSNQDAAIFSMPVTFMATPKVVASVMPRISFDQPCDQDVDQVAGTGKQASHSEHNGPPYSYTTPLAIMQAGVESPAMDYGDGAAFQRFKNPEGNSHNLPILKINPPSSLNRLCELSAAAQRIEAMTSQLFLPGAESLMPSKTAGGETETYIAKPACPGPSVDGHVLPLCQITVKIGNEAIIRRRIKGSKLFPRKKKRSSGSQVEECWDQGRPTEGSMESSSLRFRTEVTSVIEPEPCDDLTDRDTADKLWRPYYSYKPKKKSKKLRSKHRKEKRCLRYSMTSSVVPRASKDYLDKGCRSAEESISSEGTELKQRLRNTSPKTTYTCDICASTFITASGLRAHVIGCHPTFCRTCAKQCPPGESPSASFETAEDSRDYVCKSCMENGSCFDNCPRSPSTEKRYHCSFCPQRFLYLATKKSHEKKHQETAGKGYSSNNYSTDPKHPATLDLGLNLKKHVIKTEEGEDQYSIDKESKAPAGLLGRFSTEKIEPKHEEWEDTDDYMSVAPEKEIPFRINSDGHYQKTPMSPPCTDTFSPSPSEMQYRKPSPSDMQYRKPSPSDMQYRKPSPSDMQYRKPSPSDMQYRKPSPSEMQYRKPKKRIEHKQQRQTSLTSKRQKQVDYIGRETPSHKDPMATPGADSHFSYGQSSSTYLKKDSVTRATTPSSPKSEKHTYSAKKRPLYKHNTYHSGGKYF